MAQNFISIFKKIVKTYFLAYNIVYRKFHALMTRMCFLQLLDRMFCKYSPILCVLQYYCLQFRGMERALGDLSFDKSEILKSPATIIKAWSHSTSNSVWLTKLFWIRCSNITLLTAFVLVYFVRYYIATLTCFKIPFALILWPSVHVCLWW